MNVYELLAVIQESDPLTIPNPQVLLLIKGCTGYREVRRAYVDVDGDLVIEPDMDIVD